MSDRRSTWLNKLLALFLFCATFAQAAETITYYVPDLAGNPLAALDEQGNLLWKESYRPYGDRLRRQAGEQNGLWFHGMPIDDETELSYFGARWYDPVVGRFMGVDPQRFVEQKLHSFNRYTYGNNNPYRYVDPDGELPLDVIVDAGFVIYDAGRMIGAGAAYAAGALSGNKALRVEAAAGLKEVGVDLGASVVGLAVPYLPAAVTRGAMGAKNVDPKSLIGRQGRDEMSGSQVNQLAKNMKTSGYDANYPIDAANVEGKLIILDGHHRTKAAIKAGIKEVPVNVHQVTKEQASQLMREVAEVRARY